MSLVVSTNNNPVVSMRTNASAHGLLERWADELDLHHCPD